MEEQAAQLTQARAMWVTRHSLVDRSGLPDRLDASLPPLALYSPKCVEQKFSEVRTVPVLHRAAFLCTGQKDILIHT